MRTYEVVTEMDEEHALDPSYRYGRCLLGIVVYCKIANCPSARHWYNRPGIALRPPRSSSSHKSRRDVIACPISLSYQHVTDWIFTSLSNSVPGC